MFSAVINFTNSKPIETCADHNFRLIYEKSISLLRYHEYIYHIVIKIGRMLQFNAFTAKNTYRFFRVLPQILYGFHTNK